MGALRFRKTSILKILQESLLKLTLQNNVVNSIKSKLEDEEVWLDHDQMVSVFCELGNNAIEAMPEGGSLSFTVEGDEKSVTVEIADTGRGISEEQMSLLFEPFFTTKPLGEGTGLGLAVAYATVKEHNGKMTVESNANPAEAPKGTKIRITLPRRQSFQAKATEVILHE